MRAKRSRASGFTLIEVLVALVIFSFGFVALVGLLSRGLESIRRSVEVSRTVQVARDQLEASLLEASLTPGLQTRITGNGYRWTRMVEEVNLFEEDEEESFLGRAYKIRVSVAAPDRPEASSFALETLRVVAGSEEGAS